MSDESPTLEERVESLDEQINGMLLLIAALTNEITEGDVGRKAKMKKTLIDAISAMRERGYSASTQLPAQVLLTHLDSSDIIPSLLH